MASTYIDYDIQENIFSTSEIKKIFDERARMQRWLTIEAALAESQAELNVIPQMAANEIKHFAILEKLDLEKIKQEYVKGRNSIIPVIKALSDACSSDHGEYVHYGITTQDVVDTGQMLEIKETLNILYRDTRKIESILIELTKKYISTPMIGRTHGQYALPITVGLKFSVWISELRRHIERIKSLASRILVGQLSGPVGTMAAMGNDAQKVSELALKKLGLSYSPVAWHVARDNIAEYASSLAMLTSTIAKFANEIFQLSKTDVMEMEELTASKGAMSSSAMPHKNNPVLSQRIVVISKHVRALSGIAIESMIHENERDPRSLWAEWLSIPQISIYTAASLDNMIKLLQGLRIDTEKMNRNMNAFGECIASEHLMMKVGKKLGKMQAQKKLHELMQPDHTQNQSLKDRLLNNLMIGHHLDEADMYLIENPEKYIGHSVQIATDVLSQTSEIRNKENNFLY